MREFVAPTPTPEVPKEPYRTVLGAHEIEVHEIEPHPLVSVHSAVPLRRRAVIRIIEPKEATRTFPDDLLGK